MSARLAVQDLAVAGPDGPLVRGVSLAVGGGANFTILGETGSGKSLVSQAIMGLLPYPLRASGEVMIEGRATGAGSDRRRGLWGRTLAVLPQEPWLSLDPTMRSVHQVAEGYRGVDRRSAMARARDALGRLGLAGAEERYPFQLSGGMAQRVAIAASEAGGAPILIIDEPTKGLDAALRDDVVALLRSVLDAGTTLLTITHDVAVARALGGTIAVMLRGEIVEQGDAHAVLDRPSHSYTRRLLAAEPSAWPQRAPPSVGSTILSGQGLSKSYGATALFRHVNIEVRAGERLAIAGPSGSGKTTLGNILLGVAQPDTGIVKRATELRSIAFQKLYQDPVAAFSPHATLRRALEDVMMLHKVPNAELDRLMDRLRLAPSLLDRRPDSVSGGELQRFAIARLLLVSPRFIFADEPTSRLDLITQQETLDLLVEHAADRNCAILLVTHEPEIARNIAGDRTIVIADLAGQSAAKADIAADL